MEEICFTFLNCFAVGISLQSIKLFLIEIFKRCVTTHQFVAVDFTNLKCFALFKVARRCWSGNIHAKKAICKAMEENPLLKVTIPCHVQDITLLDKALKPWRALFDYMCETVYRRREQEKENNVFNFSVTKTSVRPTPSWNFIFWLGKVLTWLAGYLTLKK